MGSNLTERKTIIDDWENVEIPLAPKIEGVILDPRKSAILILDIQKQNCTCEKRPRCAASVPRIKNLLDIGREKSVFIIYSIFPHAVISDILSDVAPQNNEKIVESGPDKFVGTDLENILKGKGIKSVVIVGTAAHGAVLHTASGAVFRGFEVVVPVDGMSFDVLYAEQYTAWHLANAPIIGNHVKLTLCDEIKFND